MPKPNKLKLSSKLSLDTFDLIKIFLIIVILGIVIYKLSSITGIYTGGGGSLLGSTFAGYCQCDNDGRCETDEDATCCPGDCGSIPDCWDGTCGGSENCWNCPIDCSCESGKYCDSASKQCKTPQCGNGACESDENKNNCARDCGSLVISCGTSYVNGTCYVNETCKCNYVANVACDEGQWKVYNTNNNPLSGEITKSITSGEPKTVDFTPKEAGSIKANVTCYLPSYIRNSTTVQILEKFLSTPENCTVGNECKVTVNGCKKGTLRVFEQEGSPLGGQSITLYITETTFVGKFTPKAEGKVTVYVKCDDPYRESESIIKIVKAEVVQDFEVTLFTCTEKLSGDFECKIDFTNNLDEDAVVIFFFTDENGYGVGYGEDTAPIGKGTASATFECQTPGLYKASWTIFRESDTEFKNPIKMSRIFKSFECG